MGFNSGFKGLNYNPYITDAQITGVWSPWRLSFYGGAPMFVVGQAYNSGA